MALCLVLAAVAAFMTFVIAIVSMAYDRQRHVMTKFLAGATTTIVDDAQQYTATLKSTKSRYAFATNLASDATRPDDQDNLPDD
jgi:hypothetical protein